MMKKKLMIALAACLLTGAGIKAQNKTFHNPIKVPVGDPYVLKDSDNTYYMYGTGGVKGGFKVFASTDMVNWEDKGPAYINKQPNAWGINSFWAPEVYHHNGKYYMFYSAQYKVNPTNELENFKIGVAMADKPTGPFIDVYDRPVFNPDYPIIDANVLFENGKAYLYYSRCCYKHPVESEISKLAVKNGWYNEIEESWIYGVELKPDFSGVVGKPVLLLRPPVKIDKGTEWENRSITSREANRRWTEGSCIFKHDGLYYMMYSSNNFDGENYAVGYATSKNPLGPFVKSLNNPILQKKGIVTGTGHNSVTWSPDGKQMYCVYHGRTSATGHQRVVFIDKMHFDKKNLVVDGPTTNEQPYPAGAR